MRSARLGALVLLVFVLAACGGEQAGPQDHAASGQSASEQAPSVQSTPDPRPAAPEDPAAARPDFTDLASLSPTRHLEVHVEGQRDSREARLFTSPQAYAIYVLPQLEMTPEEPCCDLAYARVDDGFFMRIERIDDSVDLATLRGDMALALSIVGEASEAALHEFAEPGVDVEVELSMRATGEGVSMVMLVARIDGGRYRITQHLPHREALEGIPASMWAMVGSLRTTGPRSGA